MEMISHMIVHTLEDSVKLLPFLFLTYLAMEYLEHKTGDAAQKMVQRAGKYGPLLGGVAGAAPQCGFSAAASSLYAGGVITMGTLIAIFLSTSDEMLPILISEQAPLSLIVKIILAKVAIGTTAGFLIDFLFREKKAEHIHIHEVCEQEHCQCEKGIVRSAVSHTVQIFLFIILITFVLNLAIHSGGEEVLAGLLKNRPIFGPIFAGIVGLIPNCASSVVITQLYLQGALSIGAMMSGLLVGAGVGVLILFKVNHNKVQNMKILGILYAIGVISGVIIELFL